MYYTVYDFMYKDLKLCGTDLNVFALIYSFREYKGSLQSICLAVGAKSLTTFQYSLKRLVSRGFIVKLKSDNKFVPCIYKINFESGIIPKVNQSSFKGEWSSDETDFVEIGGKL